MKCKAVTSIVISCYGTLCFDKAHLELLSHLIKEIVVDFKLKIFESYQDATQSVLNGTTDVFGSLVRFIEPYFRNMTKPVSNVEYVFVVKKAGKAPLTWMFLKTLQIDVWIYVIITIVFFAFLVQRVSSTSKSCISLLLSLMGSVLRQTLSFQSSFYASKILILVWFWFATIISLSFSSVVFSLMTSPSELPTIENLLQLADAVMKGKMKCFTEPYAEVASNIMNSENENYRPLGATIVKNNWYFNTTEELIQSVSRRSAIIVTRAMARLYFGNSDALISKESLLSEFSTFLTSPNFKCKKELDTVISRMFTAGIFEKEYRDTVRWYQSNNPMLPPDPPESAAKSFRVESLHGPFLILLLGYLIGFIALIVECGYRKTSINRTSKKFYILAT